MSEPDLQRVLERLSELEAQSDARRRELRALAEQVPAAISRRALLRAAVADLRDAPNKGEIASRGARKLGRAPIAAARRVRDRLR